MTLHFSCSRASSLASVIDVEVAETDTSFLVSEVLDTGLRSASVIYSYNT